MHFPKSISKFVADTDGTTAVEYAVMLALILTSVIIGLTSAGGGVLSWWTNIDSELDSNGF